jgi:Zn-dependent M28 family amino/carboxypeptidase
LINVDDPGFTLEPPRWPAAYARTVELRGSPAPAAPSLAVMTLSADAFAAAIAGAGQDAAAILNAGAAKQALPAFDIPARLTARFPTTVRDYTSDNVLALLPGSDPALKAQVVVVSAHLDGYGFGEPVDGQSLYHGAFDDAAYVASLVRLADRRHGRPLKRGLLFAAFTGEEKGLLGSNWFVRHRAPAGADLVADINLDQLRPLFPLKILTIEALGDTSLGDTARTLAEARGVEARPDLEPERNLVRRADSWPFLAVGIPAVGFVFGYDPGTPSEAIYRDWYARRYHRPLDSLATPFDAKAAADFNCFFYDLAETVADAPERPAWKPGSELRPKPAGGT